MANGPTHRLDPVSGRAVMKAIVTTGNGGYDRLVYRDVALPILEAGDVLIQVLAAGMNNTEINTRLGWYSSSVKTGTEDAAEIEEADPSDKADGGWNGASPFPFIQGTDCCGRVTAVGSKRDNHLIGRRVLVRACIRPNGFDAPDNIWMGSDFDGAFAQFTKVPASEIFPVQSDWSDAELATIPCAYGTAENMVHRAGIIKGMRVLVTGASGGVGSAVVQLAKRRGAQVIGIAGKDKVDQVEAIGADQVIERGADLLQAVDADSIDVVVANVAGASFGAMLDILKRRGKYVSSGAIGGPMVEMDMRTFYLKDLTLIGCTGWDEPVFPNLITYIENNEIRPLVAKTFPLEEIVKAQKLFLEKSHVGNFVLIPSDTGPSEQSL